MALEQGKPAEFAPPARTPLDPFGQQWVLALITMCGDGTNQRVLQACQLLETQYKNKETKE